MAGVTLKTTDSSGCHIGEIDLRITYISLCVYCVYYLFCNATLHDADDCVEWRCEAEVGMGDG